ncbi:MAG: glycosyltransferase [Bacteroidales bacterium]|nr:glycosyltransferase [Bacteroidales bacterium]
MMKILFVINNFYITGNGLSASARRTVEYLKKAGYEVRILSGPNADNPQIQPDYLLKDYVFPIVNPIVVAQGYRFAQSNLPLMEEAARWADVIHLEEPFVIEDRMLHICQKLGKPVTATYHLHPENITNSLGPLRHWRGLNRIILRAWKRHTFDHCQYVQCPTENVLDRLRRYHINAKLELISNGIVPDKCIREAEPPKDYENPDRPLRVVYIGRLSKEKDQSTLLEAMRYSKYAKRIQLHFAGLGPTVKSTRRKAHKLYKEGVLAYEPIISFENRDGLRRLAAGADLCVHCATIEVEGLSIMEAMQQAVVPIIAQGRYSGTSQFALDRRSIFPEGNPEALAHRIDYWLDHPRERWDMGWNYAAHMEKYDIRKSVEQLVQMFQKAIDEKKGL